MLLRAVPGRLLLPVSFPKRRQDPRRRRRLLLLLPPPHPIPRQGQGQPAAAAAQQGQGQGLSVEQDPLTSLSKARPRCLVLLPPLPVPSLCRATLIYYPSTWARQMMVMAPLYCKTYYSTDARFLPPDDGDDQDYGSTGATPGFASLQASDLLFAGVQPSDPTVDYILAHRPPTPPSLLSELPIGTASNSPMPMPAALKSSSSMKAFPPPSSSSSGAGLEKEEMTLWRLREEVAALQHQV